jgi:hypothetical protein
MGDFAVSPGMVQIRRAISQRLNGAYVKSVKVGLTPGADMRNTFFTTMDAQVDYFAKEVNIPTMWPSIGQIGNPRCGLPWVSCPFQGVGYSHYVVF